MGIVLLFDDSMHYGGNTRFLVVFALMLLAAIFDFFDGFAARLLKITSPVGKQLDSLADVVTFGVLPGMIVFHFLKINSFQYSIVALLIPLFSALRLAKFNVDERQNLGFIGLPTPANALFFASLILLDVPYLKEIVLIMVPLFCYFMIAEIPLFALKFKNFSFKGNEIKYIFLLLCLVLILVLQLQAMPFIILSYLLMSVVNNKIAKS
ncbi:MAG: CDP-diacylglycerol--serine O-phosphatidyltransferase [Flavobacteriales bacterium]